MVGVGTTVVRDVVVVVVNDDTGGRGGAVDPEGVDAELAAFEVGIIVGRTIEVEEAVDNSLVMVLGDEADEAIGGFGVVGFGPSTKVMVGASGTFTSIAA